MYAGAVWTCRRRSAASTVTRGRMSLLSSHRRELAHRGAQPCRPQNQPVTPIVKVSWVAEAFCKPFVRPLL
jgi:hypothetical protein